MVRGDRRQRCPVVAFEGSEAGLVPLARHGDGDLLRVIDQPSPLGGDGAARWREGTCRLCRCRQRGRRRRRVGVCGGCRRRNGGHGGARLTAGIGARLASDVEGGEDALQDGQLVRSGDLDAQLRGERLVRRIGGDHVELGRRGLVGTFGVDEVRPDEHAVVVGDELLVGAAALQAECLGGGVGVLGERSSPVGHPGDVERGVIGLAVN